MDKKSAVAAVIQFRDTLEKLGVTVSRTILYGSYATGKQHEGSDIDVVVVSRDFYGKDYWERITLLSKAIYKVFQPIEAVAFTPDEWETGDSIIREYAREGELV